MGAPKINNLHDTGATVGGHGQGDALTRRSVPVLALDLQPKELAVLKGGGE